MAPALSAGDLLLVNPWAYQQHMPERGDVIVLRDPDEGRLLTKRVIGLPDEEVAILDGQVFIDGTVLYEPNIDQPRRGGSGGSLRVPKDEVFVLGDNRNNSADSRHYGPVPLDNIVGKIVFVVSPQRMYLMPKVSYSTPGTGP